MTGEVRRLHVPELVADQPCELALAAEAIRNFPKFTARGVALDDLTSPTARLVIETCTAVWEAGDQVNMTSVSLELQRIGRVQTVGGLKGLADLSASESVPDHGRIKALAMLRRLREAGAEVMRAAGEGDLPKAVEALQNAERAALGGAAGKVRAAHEAVRAVFAGITDTAKAAKTRVHPGLPNLHYAIGFLPVGSCTVVGADTNVGKSSFVLEMLIECAANGTRCGLISVEDPDEVTGARLLGAFSGVSSRNIQRGKFGQEEMPALTAAVEKIGKMGDAIMVADCTGETDLEVCAAMSQMAARGAKLVVVDYIGEVESSKKQQDRRNEIRWVCRRLKTHARRLGLALVVVSQLSRPTDKQTGKRPSKHDLKESGDITNSAEVIVMLWRDTESDKAPVKAWIAKCKWGGVGQWWEMVRESGTGRLREEGVVKQDLPPEQKGGRRERGF